MFKHPTCGGQHQTVLQARDCEANAKFAAETEAGHAHFLATGRDEAAEEFLAGATAKLANGHATSPILASMRRGQIDKTAILSKPIDSLLNSGARQVAPAAHTFGRNYATPGQERFVANLIKERDHDGITNVEVNEAIMDQIDGKPLYFYQARLLIEALKACPKRAAKPAQKPQEWRILADRIPKGRYALPTGPGQDKAHFYRLSERNGFIKLQEQASDSLFEVELKNYKPIFEAILAYGVEESGRLYAQLIGSCRKCGRTLTDENNPYLASGYGPDCGAKA
jgi:hypothetical protein